VADSFLDAAQAAAFELLNDPVIGANERGLIQYANRAAERLLGWTADELIGKPLTSIMPTRLHDAHLTGFNRFMTTHESRIVGRPTRVPALHRDGGEIDVELILSELPGRPRVIAVLRDLRERVELERKISTQQRILAQYAAVGVLAEAPTAREAMPRLLEATARALGWDIGIYWAVQPDTGELAVSATWSSGGAQEFLAACLPLTFAPGEALPGLALSSREAVWSRDVRGDPRARRADLAAAHGLRSALLFPVYCSRRTFGVLEYMSRQEEVLDEELRQTMKALGFQIGQFLERMENEQELRRAWAQADADRQNLRNLFEQAPAAIAIVRGPEMRYELSNAINQQLAAGRPLVGRTVSEALPELERAGVTALLHQAYETGEPVFANEFPLTLPDAPGVPARPIFMSGVLQPLRGSGPSVEGVMIFAYEVTDLVTSRERVKEAEERLRLAVEAAKVGVWDYDPKSGALRVDVRYRRLFGLGPDAEVTVDVMRGAIHPDDLPAVQEALQRSFDPSTGGEYVTEYRTRGIEDGLERWLAMRGRMLFDEHHQPIRFVGTGADITREKRALDRLQFLAEASNILSSSLDYRANLEQLAKLAVPRLADWCVVELATEEGPFEEGAIFHADPGKLALAREIRRLYVPALGTDPAITRVFATGQPVMGDVTDEALVRAARDGHHLELLRQLGIRSTMLLPVKVRKQTFAVLGLLQAESGRRHAPEDLSFAEEVAHRLAIAIENSRLYERATRAVGVRDQFLSIASHELRTPLTSLTLHLSALARLAAAGRVETFPVEKLVHRIELMDQQARRLAGLVDELLDVSRITSGRIEISRAPTDLVGLAKEVVARMDAEARRAGATIVIDAPDSVVGMWDRNRIDQVVTNLLSNAIKHAPGPIRVDVARRGDRAAVTVRDAGPGIAEADQRRIFLQFERAAPAALAGLGLGLWIASRIVAAHGGELTVTSQPGQGASFSVDLPMGAPP